MFIHTKSVQQHNTTLIVEEDLPLKAEKQLEQPLGENNEKGELQYN